METAHQRFARWAREMGLSAAAIGRLLGDEKDQKNTTSDVAVLGWMDDQVPMKEYRDAIEVLTSEWRDGPIPADDWGRTQREEKLGRKLANVRPFRPAAPTPEAA